MVEKRTIRSNKIKYEAVISDNEENVENFEIKKPTSTNSSFCLWSSLLTAILIGTYYIPSICLTFYQKWLLKSFHFPLTMVMAHMFLKYTLAVLIRMIFMKKQPKQRILSWPEYVMAVAPMGVFSGLDIGLSNWGLELVKISLYTMTKSTTIVFILGFAILFKLERKSWSLCFIVILITIGLILFTYEATEFDISGFILLLLASISSGLRWTCVQLLLQKAKIGMKNPVDMIYHMQPWMILSVIPFALWIEGPAVVSNCQLFKFSDYKIFINILMKISLGGFIAFFMELSEVLVVTYTSSLTLAIAGIFKEVVILVLAVVCNGDQMSLINFIGLLICLGGIISHVLHKLKTVSQKPVSRIYDVDPEFYELGEQLISEEMDYAGESDNDNKNDTQILFNILNSRDR